MIACYRMVEVTIQLPENIAHAFGETAEAQSQRVLEDAGIEEYRSGTLSLRQVGAMLGMDYRQTEVAETALRFGIDFELEPTIGPQTAQWWAVAGNPFGIYEKRDSLTHRKQRGAQNERSALVPSLFPVGLAQRRPSPRLRPAL